MAVTRRGHGEAQAVSLSVIQGSQEPDPSGTGAIGAEGQDIQGRLEVADRNHVAPSE